MNDGKSRRGAQMSEPSDEEAQYRVVRNHEEQYSIWPLQRELPLGWEAVGKSGTKAECLDYIEQVWTDMRPLSLRRAQGNTQGNGQGGGAA
jgi:MbtH protein